MLWDGGAEPVAGSAARNDSHSVSTSSSVGVCKKRYGVVVCPTAAISSASRQKSLVLHHIIATDKAHHRMIRRHQRMDL
ncbi:hypothetical protein ROD_19141 [Citrobacter rodentium ICC168]|uniref:Uncharacterized protein n=1 Tax=Citrobacter rodentium (strain ICC168) TaxID=637910 RepID=D2TMV9_CITRI|nr:hypothetical protein ROD_19141 [Citrobacter rodentium ICC168]